MRGNWYECKLFEVVGRCANLTLRPKSSSAVGAYWKLGYSKDSKGSQRVSFVRITGTPRINDTENIMEVGTRQLSTCE